MNTLTAEVKRNSKNQSGFIIDSLHALHLADEIQAGHFKVQEKLDRLVVYGILVQGVEVSITRCMQRYVWRHKYKLQLKLKEGEKDLPVSIVSAFINTCIVV